MRVGNMFDDLEDVHNHFLALEKRYYRIYGKYAGRYRLQPHLTKLLERTHHHWAWIPRDTLDAVIIRIHIGYERFFDWLEKGRRGRRVGLPKFKRRGKLRSAKFQTGYKLTEGTVRLSFKQWCPVKEKFVFIRSSGAIFLVNSHYETCNRMGMEAHACGLYVVGGPHICFDEWPHTVRFTTLAECIQLLRDATTDFTKLPPAQPRKEARMWAETEFSYAASLAQLNDVLRRL